MKMRKRSIVAHATIHEQRSYKTQLGIIHWEWVMCAMHTQYATLGDCARGRIGLKACLKNICLKKIMHIHRQRIMPNDQLAVYNLYVL